ncbi:MAG TPA: hypothetical protein VF699_05950 [Caulobacteraceae bacterium]|jgi:hypothetical protein
MRTAFAASTLAISLALAPATIAKPKNQKQTTTQQSGAVSGGTSGGIDGRNVSVSTSGQGYYTTSPTGTTGTGVSGTADANAYNGTVTTKVDAQTEEERARLKAMATARTEDERARSRTMTKVGPNQVVRSRTTSTYKEKGSPTVRDTVTSITCADGRVVQKSIDCRTQ